jgi:hypothetical protein
VKGFKVPSDLIDFLKEKQSADPQDSQKPVGSPMSTPEEPKGDIASAKISVQMAIKLLQQAFVKFPDGSEDGKKVLECVESLTKAFGASEDKSDRLIPAEMVSLIQANGASPEQMAMQNAQMRGQSPQGAAGP